MRTFRYNQRITITDAQHPLRSQHGTVRKLQISSKRAWVAMEVELPEALRSFPAGDTRQRWLLLEPGQCEAVKEKGAK